MAPLLVIPSDLFTPGRYGVEYAERADEIRSAAQKCGAKDILMEHFDENALQFCLLPLCEDEKLRLHIQLENGRQLNAFILLLDLFVGVRALAFADASIEPALIEAAASRRRLLVRIGEHIPLALSRLGTRFIPYASEAILPEQMLGRWIVAKGSDLACALRCLSAVGAVRLSADQRSDCRRCTEAFRRTFFDG